MYLINMREMLLSSILHNKGVENSLQKKMVLQQHISMQHFVKLRLPKLDPHAFHYQLMGVCTCQPKTDTCVVKLG